MINEALLRDYGPIVGRRSIRPRLREGVGRILTEHRPARTCPVERESSPSHFSKEVRSIQFCFKHQDNGSKAGLWADVTTVVRDLSQVAQLKRRETPLSKSTMNASESEILSLRFNVVSCFPVFHKQPQFSRPVFISAPVALILALLNV